MNSRKDKARQRYHKKTIQQLSLINIDAKVNKSPAKQIQEHIKRTTYHTKRDLSQEYKVGSTYKKINQYNTPG